VLEVNVAAPAAVDGIIRGFVSHHDETLETDHPASAGFPVLRDDVVVIADAEPLRFLSRASSQPR